MKKFILAAGLLCSLSAFAVSPNYPSGQQILGFYGTLEPKPVFYPNSLNFGSVEVGKEKTEKIKVLNNGYGYLVFRKIYLENGTQFAIKDVNCPGQLFYGQSCYITVVFKPTKAGNFTDELVMLTNSDVQPVYKIPLIGEATAPRNVIVGANGGACRQTCPSTGGENYGEANGGTYTVENPSTQNGGVIYVYENNTANYGEVNTQYGSVINSTEEVQQNTTNTPEVNQTEVVPRKKTNQEVSTTEVKKETFKLYKVKACDTLWDLSAKFYGTPLLWAAIYEANKNEIRDPWIIKEGMVLKIPVNLTPKEIKKYKAETLKLMQEMADRPLGPKCPLK